jgi:hypothetical protein
VLLVIDDRLTGMEFVCIGNAEHEIQCKKNPLIFISGWVFGETFL